MRVEGNVRVEEVGAKGGMCRVGQGGGYDSFLEVNAARKAKDANTAAC